MTEKGPRGILHTPSAGQTPRILLSADDSDGAVGAVELELPRGTTGPPSTCTPPTGKARS
jgi:hypothetical protein